MVKSFRSIFCLTIAVALSIVFLVGCSSKSTSTSALVPKKLVNSGYLTYGTAATFPPFEYMDGKNYKGFDIDMAKEIAKEMNLKVKTQSMDFNGLIPALTGNRIDIINSAMYENATRKKQVDFIPYLKISNDIVTKKTTKEKFKSLAALSGKTVAVTQGAIEAVYVNQENIKLKKAGKAVIKELSLPKASDTYVAVKNGRADAFLDSSPGVAYLMKKEPNTYKIQASFGEKTTIGIAVNKNNKDMKVKITKAIKKLNKSGKFNKLMAKYDLPKELNYYK
ncbi:ABC transporter substrate-binding protein [Liquorilactobacillus mali]|uniref:Family 3 extracellular solute-binding protein n=1 Tax=Liquorilactobacillus mali KCTC 3596 = DSM 20444 TaxID=1046596 RepID=J0L1F5_9LACO|nr:ABC transporter substrate-binding protein [Liquorilactobacillus mali]EJF01599.1 family 3 extracellular solute-binding protein [Liquorilactobacillus mali KCTC 3596 = DSM 20444]KRN08748.1 family 3 extracellular solute-binding protein [Liquorilactobacillus mali KCTC 3596 = DSM 20444]QFQ74425.1 ABC transporter substrate-binding protein [Liquorilactobacillus mali]